MRKPPKTMEDLVRRVKGVVRKKDYVKVEVALHSFNRTKRERHEYVTWTVYHEDLPLGQTNEPQTIEQAWEDFKARWKAHKAKSIKQNVPKQLEAVGTGPETK